MQTKIIGSWATK